MSGSLALVYPAMAQILWTFVVLVMAGRARVRALRRRSVRFVDIALSSEAYPDNVRKVSNNMQNQFETPILLYALAAIGTYVGATGAFVASLAWLYVATRVVHTAIHVTGNNVPRRFYAFFAGVLALVGMWIGIAAHLAWPVLFGGEG